jgi:hypothetical protein
MIDFAFIKLILQTYTYLVFLFYLGFKIVDINWKNRA